MPVRLFTALTALAALGVSSTSYALSMVYEETFDTSPAPVWGPFFGPPLAIFGAPPLVVVSGPPSQQLQWCGWLDLEVTQNATMISFELINSSHAHPISVDIIDATGSPGTVLPGGIFGYGTHTVQGVAGPNAVVEIRGGNCETWIDDVRLWELP
ncbi:MAG: hypothetical protein AAF602_08620 [Myxococcota bacterium]